MYKAYYKSPIGFVELISDEDSLLALSFVEEAEKMDMQTAPGVLKLALEQIDEYFQGKRNVFDIKLNAKGTEFQQKVWQRLIEVPYGKTACYGDIAAAVGNGKASRAVGGANNKNKIAIIIPCHRIVGADGSMTGYAGGLWRKEWLLQHEKSNR
ncbi:MAG: methylated-DNA--[protein]-cysteine S-methyltransferase [Clostridia bacterium]|jgi:methylated-DNA-[protein]-cysteine S-methyltransferase|nr:methylated-DNA--[protein]-cysteine S-methyltransferase [Clostridia bacterium]